MVKTSRPPGSAAATTVFDQLAHHASSVVSHAAAAATAPGPGPDGSAAPLPSQPSVRSQLGKIGAPARAMLDAARRTARPNGVALTALGNTVAGARSMNGGGPLNTMRDGIKRNKPLPRLAHTPLIIQGGVNQSGRHARGAARLAVDQLLGTNEGALPLPHWRDFLAGKATPPSTAASEDASLPRFSAALSSEQQFDLEALRLFGAGQADEAAMHTLLEGLKTTRGEASPQLSGPFERPTLLLHALAASTGGQLASALEVMAYLGRGLDIGDATGAVERDQARGRATAAGTGRAAPASPGPVDAPQPISTAAGIELTARAGSAPAAATAEANIGDRAWHTARLLTRAEGPGFAALQALSPVVAIGPAEHARRVQSLRMVLEATDRQARRATHPPADLKGVAAASADHATEQLVIAAATKLWHQPDVARANLTRAEKTTHFNWRQNLRQAGPEGNARKAQQRTHKSLTWLIRAETRGTRKHNWTFNPARFAGHRKTPISAMQDGTLGAHLDTDQKEREKFDTPFGEAIPALRRALARDFRTLADGPAALHRAVLLAKLDDWERQVGAGAAPEACDFKPSSGAIVQAALTLLRESGHPAATMLLSRAAASHQQKISKEKCRFESLRQWGDAAPAGQDTDLYREKVDAAQAAIDHIVMKPDDMRIDSVRAMLKKYVQIVPMGNRWRNFDGATVGINNTSLPFLTAPDIRLRKNTSAVVEVNTGGHAHEIFFGKQHLWQEHQGAQHTFGVKLGAIFNFGSTEGGNAGADLTSVEGVRFRFLRRLDADLNGTNGHRDMAAHFVDRLCDAAKAMQHERSSASAVWDRLIVDQYFDSPDFAVSWQDHLQQSSKVQLYSVNGVSLQAGGEGHDGDVANAGAAGGTASNGGGGAFIGASATVGYEINPTIGLNRSERSGAMARTVMQMGAGGRGIARAGVGVSPPGAPRLNIASVATTFAGHGTVAAVRAIEENGFPEPNFFHSDVEYETFSAFKKGMRANAPIWHSLMGKENFEAMLEDTRKNFAPNQRPAERWRMRADAVRTFAALRSGMVLRDAALEHTSAPGQRARMTAERNQMGQQALSLFTDFARWWEPVGTWNLELNSSTKSLLGVNFWGQALPERTVSTDRELSWQGVSTKTLNEGTNALRVTPRAAALPTSRQVDAGQGAG